MARPSAQVFAFLLISFILLSGCIGLTRPDFIIIDQNATTGSCDNNADCNITGNIFDATGHHTSAYSAGTNILLDTTDGNKFSLNDENFLGTDNNVTGQWNFGNTTTFFGGIGNNGCSITWEDGNGLFRCPIISVFEIRAETVKDINTQGNIIPAEHDTFTLGSQPRQWDRIWGVDANITNAFQTKDIYASSITPLVESFFYKPFTGGSSTNFFMVNATNQAALFGITEDEGFSDWLEFELDVIADAAVFETTLNNIQFISGDAVITNQKFIIDNIIAPQPDASHDLGGLAIEQDSVSKQRRFRDLYLSGTANVKDVNATGDVNANNVRVFNEITDGDGNNFFVGEVINTRELDLNHFGIQDGNFDFSDTFHELIHIFNGMIIETIDVNVTSNGSAITLSLGRQGANADLNLYFSDDFSSFDTTPPATVSLTAGSDTSPQQNFIYIPQATKTLTANTTGFPDAQHAPIATVIVQSAVQVQDNNALKIHVWTDHAENGDEQGHISHINEWIREQHATWMSGVAQTLTITTNAGVPDAVNFKTTSGLVFQLHPHTVPVFDTAIDTNIYVVNDSSAAFTQVNDLNALLTDSDGDAMTNKYFNLVIWASVSEKAGDSKLFVNLPSCSYVRQTDAIADVDGCTNFSIPADFKGAAFLISRLTLRHQSASGGTWTSIQETDLRGQIPNIIAGGGASAIVTEFPDNAFLIFDETDVTKIGQFQLANIVTGNTRTITWPNRDLDLNTPVFFDVAINRTHVDFSFLEISQTNAKGAILTVGESGDSKLIESFITGDIRASFTIDSQGILEWGDGTNAVDVSLFRTAADHLKTADKFEVGLDLNVVNTIEGRALLGHVIGPGNLATSNALNLVVDNSGTTMAMGISNTASRFIKLGVEGGNDITKIAWDNADFLSFGTLLTVSTPFSSFVPAMTLTNVGKLSIEDDLIVDGNNMGITLDSDLISMAPSALTINGTVNATGGFLDNGTAGIDKAQFTFDDDNQDTHTITINGGLITQWDIT